MRVLIELGGMLSAIAAAVAGAPAQSTKGQDSPPSAATGSADVTKATSDATRRGKRDRSAALSGNPGEFFGADNYPPEALRKSEQGRVVAQLTVGPDGRVTACDVYISSGSPSLDATTCGISMKRVIFTPARDEHGRAIASTYTLPVRWVLPQEVDFGSPVEVSTAKFPDSIVEMDITVAADGRVEHCAVVEASPKPVTDPCEQYPPGRQMSSGSTRNGKPVGSHVNFRFSTRTRFDP